MRWLALLALVLAPSMAHADDELAAITLRPWNGHDGTERPFRYIVEVRPNGSEPLDVVADRRLLTFTVRPKESRRRYTCRHPAAPNGVVESRVRRLHAGSDEESWSEWIDLRMYCTGPARDALSTGATVEVRHGWPRRTRNRWVVRRPEAPQREWIAHLQVEPFDVPPLASEMETSRLDADMPSPIEIALPTASARTGEGLVLRPAIRAREGTERVYVRPDAWSFLVRGPLGDVYCRIPMGGGTPPPDLYRRITPRSPARSTLDADFFCPEHTFELAGVYEIAPVVALPHSGREWGLDAVTGRFRGPSAVIRITRGSRGYVEQVPDGADESSDGTS